MEELVDDPLVLRAALSLVDEWYADAEKGGISTTESASSHGLRKRVREDLASLRSTVEELQQRARKRREPQPDPPPELLDVELDGHTTEESVDDAVVSTPRAQAQARRLLQAVRSYTRVHEAMQLALSVIEQIAIRPVDMQILNTFNSRLDSLTSIARVHRAPSSLGIEDHSEDLAFTPNRFRAQVHTMMSFPFKLSIVADVLWGFMQSMRFGNENREQLSVCTQNEVFGMVATSVHTPSGYFAEHGATALRRVNEPDGSVLLLHTVITTSSRRQNDNSDRPNVLAGCTVKQAGWNRLRLAPGKDGARRGQPLVLMERVQGIVIEASPGHTVSRDQLELILDVFGEMSSTQARSWQAMENLLMDASSASKTKARVHS